MKKEFDNEELCEGILNQLDKCKRGVEMYHLGKEGEFYVGCVELEDGRVYQYMINSMSINPNTPHILYGTYIRVDGKSFAHGSMDVTLGVQLGRESKAVDITLYL